MRSWRAWWQSRLVEVGVICGVLGAACGPGQAQTNPVNLTLKGRWPASPPGYAWGAAVAGPYALVTEYSGAVRVLEISDPTHPRLVGGLSVGNAAYGVGIAGSHAYVGNGTTNLVILDLSSPTNPVVTAVASLGTNVATMDLSVVDQRLFVMGAAGVAVYDLSNPTNPQPVTRWGGLGGLDAQGQHWGPYALGIAGHYAYVAEAGAGLEVLDIAEVSNPRSTGRYQAPGRYYYGVAVAGSYAYLARTGFGLDIVDISDPAHPVRTAQVSMTDPAGQVTAADGYLYVTDETLEIYQISELPALARPTVAGQNLTLFWNDAAQGMRLQQASSLGASAWHDVTVAGPTNHLSLPLTNGAAWFRLIQGGAQD